jgi:hypothetical protein
MLSLEECREILGEEAPADERQLEELRENAYRLARLVIEICRDQKTSKNRPADEGVGDPPMTQSEVL